MYLNSKQDDTELRKWAVEQATQIGTFARIEGIKGADTADAVVAAAQKLYDFTLAED